MTQDVSMLQVLNPQAANETYLSIQPQLARWVEIESRFRGSDPDDILEVAQEAFLKAYASYEYGQGTVFTSWFYWKFHSKLKDYRKKQYREHQRKLAAKVDWNNLQAREERTWKEVSEDIGLDAEVVAELAIDPPADLISTASKRGGTSYAWRTSIKEALQEMGWTPNRIQEAVRQLMEIIGS